MSTSEDETKWLPFTVSITPCCTWAKLTMLGESELISGAGRALPHSGFKVLLQPRSSETLRPRRQARDTPQVRKRMVATPLGMGFPRVAVERNIRTRGRNVVQERCRPGTNADSLTSLS